MKPHKHAELIKAWADGAEIERFSITNQQWRLDPSPSWEHHIEYRIKPEPKPDDIGYAYLTIRESYKSDGFYIFRERSVNSNLKLTFDGETGKLKSAEVLK